MVQLHCLLTEFRGKKGFVSKVSLNLVSIKMAGNVTGRKKAEAKLSINKPYTAIGNFREETLKIAAKS
jgi:hypothetical protein